MSVERRLAASFRLDVAPVDGDPANGLEGHQVLVHVDGVELTARGAGLGMSPFDLLVPDNRLVATTEPHRVPIARCECGDYGCGVTDVVITRDGDLVHWDWQVEVPLPHGTSVPAAAYDEEVARVAADHRWERPQDTAARLVLTGGDRDDLRRRGLRLDWAGADYRSRQRFVLTLRTLADDGYQVFLRVPRADRSPEEVASAVLDLLATSTRDWPATYHSIRPRVTDPPPFAGPGWRREDLGLR